MIKSFEDRERMQGEILSLFYEMLYLWTVAFASPMLISYSNFIVCFALFS